LIYWYISQHSVGTPTHTADTSANSPAADIARVQGEKYNEAVTVSEKDGVVAGQAVLDNELQNTTDAKTKAILLNQKSSLAGSETGGNDYVSALAYAKQADALNPTSESAANIAAIAQSMNDTQQAIQYYQLAMTRIGDPAKAEPMLQSSYGYYQQQIEALKSAN
jgi:tetratricopeptide (TPR) repeat protein